MSRYIITAKDRQQHICFVGYDKPLETYFAQVLERATFDPEELRDTEPEELMFDDENIALWVGTNPSEIGTVTDLQTRLASYTTIPAAVRVKLERDGEQRSEPTPLQREMHALIRRWSETADPKNR